MAKMQAALRAKLDLANPIHFLALGFGSGLASFMPGTFGSLAAIPLVLLVIVLGSMPLFVFCALVFCIAGIWICDRTAKDMGVHDHPAIVWDEVAGMFITLLFVPITWQTLIAGFALFRLFDILKPWPIRLFDKRVHGGFGIMLDDVVAGIFACACLHLMLYLGFV